MGAQVLLLEGLNKTGKTTVARMLERKGFCYFKDNTIYGLKDRDESFKSKMLEDNLIMAENIIDIMPSSTRLIIDRHHMSDFVYGGLYRGINSHENALKFNKRDYEMSRRNSVLILMTDSSENISERNHNNLQDTIKESSEFQKCYCYSSMIKYRLCLSDPQLKDKLSTIIKRHFNVKF